MKFSNNASPKCRRIVRLTLYVLTEKKKLPKCLNGFILPVWSLQLIEKPEISWHLAAKTKPHAANKDHSAVHVVLLRREK